MTVTFTDTFEPYSSSLVDAVYYDENTKELSVDLDGEVYRYSGVPREVFEGFRTAPSVGRYYTPEVKRKFGPGEYLGEAYDVDFEAVTKRSALSAVGGPSGLTERGGESSFRGGSSNRSSGPHISLSAPRLATESVTPRWAVTFEVEGKEGERVHTLTASTVIDAVLQVVELGDMLDLDFNVVGVVKA